MGFQEKNRTKLGLSQLVSENKKLLKKGCTDPLLSLEAIPTMSTGEVLFQLLQVRNVSSSIIILRVSTSKIYPLKIALLLVRTGYVISIVDNLWACVGLHLTLGVCKQ